MKKLRKLVASLALASLFTGVFPYQAAAVTRLVNTPDTATFRGATASGQLTMTTPLSLVGAFSIGFWANLWDSSGIHSVIGHSSTTGKIAYTNNKWFIRAVDGGASDNTLTLQPLNTWHHYVLTKDGSNVVTMYIDGVPNVLFSGAAQAGTLSLDSVMYSTGGANFAGNLDNLVVYNRLLSTTEINALYRNNQVPTNNLLVYYKFDEGAGTTTADSSGNGNTLTIVSGTFSSLTPYGTRQAVNQNLVKNGNFEYAPPFVAAGNTAVRWIDGTAAGSSSNDLFRWSFRSKAGTATAQFDSTNQHSGSSSLKVSTTAVASFIETAQYNSAGMPTASDAATYLIKVSPSTSYTYSYWMKTNYVSGDSSSGATIAFQEVAPTGGTVLATNVGTYVKTTTGWTLYTGTFTTNVGTGAISVDPRIYGHTGTATLIMDAWFDDIVLTPTTAVTRMAVAQRQNLLQYSEQLGTAPWSAQGSMAVTANQATAPDGTLTADQAVATGSASLLQAVTVVPGATYTFSFWAKNNGGSIASYRTYDNTNSAEIVAQTSYFSQINGSTWTRVSFTFTAPAGCISALVYPMSVPATGGNVFLWGAQLVNANWPGPYTVTGASPVNTGNIRSIVAQGQNLFTYSEQFDNAVWGKTSTTISANTSTNPVDGAMTADTFISSSSATTNYGVYYNTPGITFMARPYTFSVFLKYTNYQYVLVEMDNSGTSGAIFDLVGGTATGVATGVVASMISMGNGWYRCAVTKTMTASTQYPDILLNNSPTSFTRTATATSGVTSLLLFGAQLVQANWPGAYTPTVATAVNNGNIRSITY